MFKVAVKTCLLMLVITLASSSIFAEEVNQFNEFKNKDFSIDYVSEGEEFVTIKIAEKTKSTEFKLHVDEEGKSYQTFPNGKKVTYKWSKDSNNEFRPVSIAFEGGQTIVCGSASTGIVDACDNAIYFCAAAIITCAALPGSFTCFQAVALCGYWAFQCEEGGGGGIVPEIPIFSKFNLPKEKINTSKQSENIGKKSDGLDVKETPSSNKSKILQNNETYSKDE